MSTQFLTPVGRLVQGDLLTAQTKDNKGQPLVVKTGPNKGQPTQRFFMAIAIPKTAGATHWMSDPNMLAFATVIYTEAKNGYGTLFNAQGQCTHPRFAWKVADGDGVDADGKPNASKPGHAGCWIIKFSSSFAPKVLMNGAYVNDPNAVKRGYFVRVAGNCAPNTGSDVPGIYLNHEAVEFCAYGEEIRSGIDAISVFGAAGAAALPPGATMTPPAPTGNGGLPGAPAMAPAMAGAPPMQPGMPAMAPAAPAMPAPNHAFVANAAAPAMPGMAPAMPGMAPQAPMMAPQAPMAPAAPAAPVYVPTQAAQGFTLEQWIASSGQTADQLVAAGIFARQ